MKPALLLAAMLFVRAVNAQPARDAYRPWLPPAVAASPALRAFTVAPFADADIQSGETRLAGFFVASTDSQSVTLKIVEAAPPGGPTQTFDPPRAREIRLTEQTALSANAQKRESLDWTQVIDYAPIIVVGKEGGAGQPLVARKIDVLDGYMGDLLKDPEFQKQLQAAQRQETEQEQVLRGVLPPNAMWLESVDLSQMTTGYGQPNAGKSVDGAPLLLGGHVYAHGVGTHAESDLLIDLKGKATRFAALVGIDDEMGSRSSIVFSVWVDGEKVAGSTILRTGDEPEWLEADLTGAKTLRLQVSDGGDGGNSDHADWAGALIQLVPGTGRGEMPVAVELEEE